LLTPPRLKSFRALLPGIVGFVVVTGGLLLALHFIGVERLRQMIDDAGPFAPLVYIGIKIVTYVAAPLSSGPLQLSAGVFFGLVPGILYTLLAEVIGGSIDFWLARRFGRPVVERLVGKEDMPRIDRFITGIVDWKTLVYARVFLSSFYDFISYAVGFSKLSYRTYLIVSIFAGILPTALPVFLGTSLTGDSSNLLPIYIGLGIISLIPLLFQKQIRRLLKLDKTLPSE
jgi:uncharacterized membrane protein YdjX (TVP38/TMEM64 family)